jgi:anti-sigma regulatory factor (Ser/Thr protein kinase)
MPLVVNRRPNGKHLVLTLLFPALFLCGAYSLLALTFVQSPGNLMQRCVLMNLNLARIWSVAHVEIGMSYIGVFIGMAYYLLRAGHTDRTHLRDLIYAFAYLAISFILDYECVRYFSPFQALLVGDAIVMTFTFLVSKQIWFQRLLGIFVPMVFLTCAIGHLLEGLSYWHLTYPANVPWTMVTADIGFAILVNATRFPAFIRGHDLENEIDVVKAAARSRQTFVTDVLASVTDGRFRLVIDESDFRTPLNPMTGRISLAPESLSTVRKEAAAAWRTLGYPEDREPDMLISVGEAIMNAVVHGVEGTAQVFGDGNQIQICIEDKGNGIQLERIPKATLEKGYSTAGSLGHGFWIILQTVDRLDLFTSSSGTKILLTFDRVIVSRDFSFMK